MKHGNTTTHNDRRAFLRATALLAGGVALSPLMRVLPAHAAVGYVKSTEQRMLMGTVVSMTILAPSAQHGQDAMGAAYDEINRLISIFNRFDAVTPLAVLNAEGKLPGAPAELVQVMQHGQGLSLHTQGRFDATVAPVVALLEKTKGKPSVADFQAALDLVDARRIDVNDSSIRFTASGMAATLDGIAKGYIADCAANALSVCGVEHFLIDAGGDIRAQGSSSGTGKPWRVAIEDPHKAGNYPGIIEMTRGAVATSGGYEIFFNPERTANHLINPRTGLSPQYIKSVSVTAPSVMQADGLATALSLMPPREALAIVNALPGHACLLVTSTGATLASRYWA